MDLLVVAALWVATMLLIILALLFGQNPSFARTPLPRLHWLLTRGLGAAFRRGGGGRLMELCCERSNPAVQILFVAMLGGCYALFFAYIFPLLPQPGVPTYHKYTGTLAALGTLALFAAASFCDPGTVTPANLAAHQALYPYDGLVFPGPQDCSTCRQPRPARSKHCSACRRCVARCDHHCIWLNTCVGLNNTRWFLAFLLATAALCGYAAVVGYHTVAGDMAARGTWTTAFHLPETGEVIHLSDSWRYLWRYLSVSYGPQVAVTFFAGCAGWIVMGFTGYQLYLICSGVTTSEVHKRRQLALALDLKADADEIEAAAERALAAGRAGADGASRTGDGSAPASTLPGAARSGISDGSDGGSSPHRRQQQQQQQGRQAKRRHLPNHYNRGALRNLAEVLFPERYLRQAAAAGGWVKKGE